MSQILVNGALLELEGTDELAETTEFMDGFLLGAIIRKSDGTFRATLCRVWPRTFKAPSHLPEIWEPFVIDSAICASLEDGLRILEDGVTSVVDQNVSNYRFEKSSLAFWSGNL
jgi:hypothetical protein